MFLIFSLIKDLIAIQGSMPCAKIVVLLRFADNSLAIFSKLGTS